MSGTPSILKKKAITASLNVGEKRHEYTDLACVRDVTRTFSYYSTRCICFNCGLIEKYEIIRPNYCSLFYLYHAKNQFFIVMQDPNSGNIFIPCLARSHCKLQFNTDVFGMYATAFSSLDLFSALLRYALPNLEPCLKKRFIKNIFCPDGHKSKDSKLYRKFDV